MRRFFLCLSIVLCVLAMSGKTWAFPPYWEKAGDGTYGTLTDNANTDGDTYNVKPLGFTFYYYGVPYTEVGIGSDGVLAFNVSDGTNCQWNHKWTWENTGRRGTAPVIAPLWTAWDASDGNIYYRTAGTPGNRKFIVTYEFAHHYWQDGASGTFQVVLFENGFENGNIQLGWAGVIFSEVDSDGERSLTGVSDGHGNITSMGEGTEFDEGTLGNQNRWFVYNEITKTYEMWVKNPAEVCTLIELDQFSVTYQGDRYQPIVFWSTLSEIDSAGFNIWRSSEQNGEYIKINPLTIGAEGGTISGKEYAYHDVTAKAGIGYNYRLEEIDNTGKSTFYGPISAAISADEPTGNYFYPAYYWLWLYSTPSWASLWSPFYGTL